MAAFLECTAHGRLDHVRPRGTSGHFCRMLLKQGLDPRVAECGAVVRGERFGYGHRGYATASQGYLEHDAFTRRWLRLWATSLEFRPDLGANNFANAWGQLLCLHRDGLPTGVAMRHGKSPNDRSVRSCLCKIGDRVSEGGNLAKLLGTTLEPNELPKGLTAYASSDGIQCELPKQLGGWRGSSHLGSVCVRIDLRYPDNRYAYPILTPVDPWLR